MQNNLRKILRDNPVIPVVTIDNLDVIDEMINTLVQKGIACIEVTLRTNIAWEAIAYIQEHYKHKILVGVGTVINVNQIQKCIDREVDFMVSPGFSPRLLEACLKTDIPFLPGVSSASDIIYCQENGFNFLKFYPAQLNGGIKALTNFLAVFPEVKFCATGGINEDNFEQYLQLDNVLAVGGSWLLKK